jgi:hypothetical protein
MRGVWNFFAASFYLCGESLHGYVGDARSRPETQDWKREADKKKGQTMPNDAALRQHLIKLLKGGDAHVVFEDAVKDFPAELRGATPDGAEHSPWQVLEHLRITQWDILDFSVNPEYRPREWPKEYWPETAAPPDTTAWDKCIHTYLEDREALCALVADEKTDLYAKIPHGDGQTILREALVVADHNAYHLGQLVLLRRLLGAWK